MEPVAYILLEELSYLVLLASLRKFANDGGIGGNRVKAIRVTCEASSYTIPAVNTVRPEATVQSSLFLVCEISLG